MRIIFSAAGDWLVVRYSSRAVDELKSPVIVIDATAAIGFHMPSPAAVRSTTVDFEVHTLIAFCGVCSEDHWISESSIRPTSPSVYSESSSGRSSPASETSSISATSLKSNSTKASSLWGSIKSVTTPAWWDKGSRKSPSPPLLVENVGNAKFASKLPVAKALGPVRESRVLASRDMWEAKAPVALEETPKRNFRTPTAPAAQTQEKVCDLPLRQKFRPVVAFKANWDEALAEAIAAGMPKKTLSRTASKADWEAALAEALSKSKVCVQRPKATPEMWAAALDEAVARSIITKTASLVTSPRYDPAVRHPVFFGKFLVTTASEVHPAAAGYVNIGCNVVQYDPALLHPVFFTESLVTTAAEVHPAAIGYVKANPKAPQYDPALIHPVFFTECLVSTTSEIHPAAIGYVKGKANVPQYDPTALHPVFFTSNLVSSVADIHPAAIGHVVRPQAKYMWNAPRSHAAIFEAPVGSMWLEGKVAADQFEHDKTPIIRKTPVSQSIKLSTLDSTNTWKPIKPVQAFERNWISVTRPAGTQTWTAPNTVVEEQGKALWTPKSIVMVASPDMFTNIIGSFVKKPSTQRSIALPQLNSKALFTPVSVSNKDDTHWLHTTSTAIDRTGPSAGMWMAPKKPSSSKKTEPDMFSHIKSQPVKKAASARPAPLTLLDSNELFSCAAKTRESIHWLHSTSSSSYSSSAPSSPVISAPTAASKSLVRSQTWTSRTLPASLSNRQESNSMWSLQPNQIVLSPVMFSNSHTEPWSRKKRSDSGVDLGIGQLESSEMWSRKWEMPESPRMWLVRCERRVSKVQFRY